MNDRKESDNRSVKEQDVGKESGNEFSLKKPETEPKTKQASIIPEVCDAFSDCDGSRKVKVPTTANFILFYFILGGWGGGYFNVYQALVTLSNAKGDKSMSIYAVSPPPFCTQHHHKS